MILSPFATICLMGTLLYAVITSAVLVYALTVVLFELRGRAR